MLRSILISTFVIFTNILAGQSVQKINIDDLNNLEGVISPTTALQSKVKILDVSDSIIFGTFTDKYIALKYNSSTYLYEADIINEINPRRIKSIEILRKKEEVKICNSEYEYLLILELKQRHQKRVMNEISEKKIGTVPNTRYN